MEFNQINIDDSIDVVNYNKKSFQGKEINENLNYLYPNGHRTTHQMRWFKGSRDRGIKTDIAA